MEYERQALAEYVERLKGTGSSPSQELLGFRKRPFAGPATPMTFDLSKESRVRLTHALLQSSPDLDPWTFCHLRQARYPERL